MTPRQREVANHVVRGLTSKQIARYMAISHQTVAVHRRSIFRAFAVHSVAELAIRLRSETTTLLE
ncbi:LuxR C-terminal-related transcriptional regulator [Massilia atriviolacea]|uniref:LuxR C-terminal-related transcriptional regulator n=1 Tax=Massilia atriviolacea TaxID=2495579 RepID=UPI001E2C35CA|nr:LuxR C-terminal-related transcriptional regulator [Massilia atriviolacea]